VLSIVVLVNSAGVMAVTLEGTVRLRLWDILSQGTGKLASLARTVVKTASGRGAVAVGASGVALSASEVASVDATIVVAVSGVGSVAKTVCSSGGVTGGAGAHGIASVHAAIVVTVQGVGSVAVASTSGVLTCKALACETLTSKTWRVSCWTSQVASVHATIVVAVQWVRSVAVASTSGVLTSKALSCETLTCQTGRVTLTSEVASVDTAVVVTVGGVCGVAETASGAVAWETTGGARVTDARAWTDVRVKDVGSAGVVSSRDV
jgi:hypothetical protein